MARIAEVPFREVERLVKAAFPGAKSRRTVKIDQRAKYHVTDYWDGGSRDECRFIKLATMQVISAQEVPSLTEGHVYSLAMGEVELSPASSWWNTVSSAVRISGYGYIAMKSNS